MTKLLAALLSGGVLFAAGFARADPPSPSAPPIHVIAVQSDDAEDQADALTAALRSRVRALHGFSLAESDFALEVLTLGLKCSEVPDDACQAKIADHIHADRYIWGSLKRTRTSRQVVADLRFWSKNHPTMRTQVIYSDNLTTPGDEPLKRLADDMLAKLVGPNQATASVALSAPRSPVTPQVQASTREREEMKYEPLEETSDGHRTAGWAGVGLGGVLVAAGLYSVIRIHDIDTNDRFVAYRARVLPGHDVCAEARGGFTVQGAATPSEMQDFCSQATTFEMLQYVFFGLGAVSAGAGIYLLATDKSGAVPSQQSKWTVTPSASKSEGRVTLRVAF